MDFSHAYQWTDVLRCASRPGGPHSPKHQIYIQELLFYSLHPLHGFSLTCSRSIFHFGTYSRRLVRHLNCVDVGAFGRPSVPKIIDNGPFSRYSSNMRCHSSSKRDSACFCAPVAILTRPKMMPIHLFDPTKLRAASTLTL